MKLAQNNETTRTWLQIQISEANVGQGNDQNTPTMPDLLPKRWTLLLIANPKIKSFPSLMKEP